MNFKIAKGNVWEQHLFLSLEKRKNDEAEKDVMPGFSKIEKQVWYDQKS